MRCLLTGYSGFLGHHIINSPAADGSEIICVSRASNATGKNLVAIGPGPWTPSDFKRILVQTSPDVVIHCAGITHAETSKEFFEANTLPAACLLDAIRDMDRRPRILLIGSAAEYGFVSPDHLPVSEVYPCRPRNPYGISKFAQTLLGMASAEAGLSVLTVRLFNAVGRNMPPKLSLSSFARRIVTASKSNGTISVGDITVERDFIDVTEAARILLALARMQNWPWPVVNLCSGQTFRLGVLLDAMIATTGRPLRIDVDPALVRLGDMQVFFGSVDRLVEIGLRPAAPDFDQLIPQLLMEAKHAVTSRQWIV